MLTLVDSHAHLTSEELALESDALVERASAAHVRHIVNICTDEASLTLGLELAKRLGCVSLAAATTPHTVSEEGASFFPKVREAALRGQLVAVGETGLDYHYEHSPRKVQQEYLHRYLEFCVESHLPVVIHCRDAFEDFFSILDGYPVRGVLHCFTGTREEAEEVIRRGFYLSLSGIVTFKRSEALREVASLVPLDQLLIETDAPYLAPQSRRGKRNEPSFLPEVAETIAAVRGISLDIVAQATSDNARRLFQLPSLNDT